MGAVGHVLGTGGGGGAAAFAPADIAGLVEDIDFNTLSLTDGDPISLCVNGGTGGSNATATGTARPTFRTGANGINGLGVAQFDGVDDFMTIARTVALEPTAISVFVVVQSAVLPPAFSYLFSKVHQAGDHASVTMNFDGTSNFRSAVQVATTGLVTSATASGGLIFNGSPQVLGMVADGATLVTSVNGDKTMLGADKTAVGNIQYIGTDWILGSFDGSGFFCALKMARLLIYNTALSAVNRWKVASYLGQRYAIP